MARDTNTNSQNQLEIKEFKSFYKTVGGEKGSMCMYPTRLDTYGCGCAHNCGYCYGRSHLDFRKLWFPDNPRVADIEKIEKTIQKIPPGSVVRLGGMTDCFQPMEVKKQITLETIKLLNEQRVRYLLITKSPIVSYPYFMEAMDKELAHIQITVTCLDHAKSKLYENAPPPEQRVRAILTLQKNGFDTAIRLSPLLEEFMDFDTLNSLGIEKCIVEFLRYNGWIKEWFTDMRYDLDKYTLYDGSYRHLPLDEKLRIIKKVNIPSISVCEKVPEHYYSWQKYFNPNPSDCCNLRISPQRKEEATQQEKSNKRDK
jgi:DNA repair photolyase